MPSFTDHQSNTRAKILLVGDSGNGKTTLLASLANAGYKVRILDFDNGLDVLRDYLNEGADENIEYVTLSDEPGKTPKAFDTATKLIYREWIDPVTNKSLGRVQDWGGDHVLVIDSATFMGQAALRKALAAANKQTTDKLSQPDWGEALRYVTTILAVLTSENIRCNLIITAHLRKSGEDSPTSKELPHFVTANFSATVGAYFNNIFRVEKRMVGKEEKVVIRTRGDHRTDLKTASPNLLKAEEAPDLAYILAQLTSKKS